MFDLEQQTFHAEGLDPLPFLRPPDDPTPLPDPLADVLDPDPDHRQLNLLGRELQLRFDATDTEYIAGARLAAGSALARELEPRVFCGEAHDAADDAANPLFARPPPAAEWRCKQNKVHRTGQGVLALCVNIGTTPPDVVRVPPCAHQLCWKDPIALSPSQCLDRLGRSLQRNYERWRDRVRYRPIIDPKRDELQINCEHARLKASESQNERVLFHYNGYGVPRPTRNGELWVFNESYTQYIPLALYDLHSWLGDPAVYVFDCPSAARLLPVLRPYQSRPASDLSVEEALPGAPTPGDIPDPLRNVIMLLACQEDEDLPSSPELPADAFTSALTTPLHLALRVHAARRPGAYPAQYDASIDRLLGLGTYHERGTPPGELWWILTAITDSIAFALIPQPLFQKLFRGDLLLAALFRHFLLAERVLTRYGVRPTTYPLLPPCSAHPLWAEWDRVMDGVLQQLPDLLHHGKNEEERATNALAMWRPSDHFERHLQEFRHWLGNPPPNPEAHPPPHLPMLVQVFLSTKHRVNALVLFARYLDMGRWAVQQGLLIGGELYAMRLLVAGTRDMHPPLLHCWAKMLATDPSLQDDLVYNSLRAVTAHSNGQRSVPPPPHVFFLRHLADDAMARDHRTLAAYCLACICAHNPSGQDLCFRGVLAAQGHGLLDTCRRLLQAATQAPPAPGREAGSWVMHVRCLCLCLGRLLEDQPEYALEFTSLGGIQLLQGFLHHALPPVRTAAVYALGCLICSSFPGTEEWAEKIEGLAVWVKRHSVSVRAPADVERFVAVQLLELNTDASVVVRAELAAALARLVCGHMPAVLRAVARRAQGEECAEGGAEAEAGGGGDSGRPNSAGAPGGGAAAQPAAQQQQPSGEGDGAPQGSGEDGEEDDDEEEEDTVAALQAAVMADDPSTHSFYGKLVEVLVRLATDPAPKVACLGRKALAVAGCSVEDPFSDPPPPHHSRPPSPGPPPPHHHYQHPNSRHAGSNDGASTSYGASTSTSHHAPPHPTHTFGALTSRFPNGRAPGLSISTPAPAAPGPSHASTPRLQHPALTTPPLSPLSSAPPPLTRGPFPITYNPPAGHHAAHCSPFPDLHPTSPDPDALPPRPDDFPDPPFPLAVTNAIARPFLRPTTTRWRELHAPLWTRPAEPARAEARFAKRRDGRAHCAAMPSARLRAPLSIPLQPHPRHPHRAAVPAPAPAPAPLTALAFHTYHSFLLAADPNGLIHVHEYYSKAARAGGATPRDAPFNSGCFHVATGAPYAPASGALHPPVVALYQANEVFTPLPASSLIACTADGTVRVWRNYPSVLSSPPRSTPPRTLQLVTTWQAVPLASPLAPPAPPAAFAWSPLEPRLYAAGGAAPATIHCWDATQERCTDVIDRSDPCGGSPPPSPIELLASCADPPLLLSAEADGMVRVYDLRASDPEVFSHQHCAPRAGGALCGALLRPCALPHAVVLGTRSGELTMLDMRAAGGPGVVVQSVAAHAAGHMCAISAHAHAPILATAADDGAVKVWHGRSLTDAATCIRPRDQPVKPVRPHAALAFHAAEPLMAVADATPGLTVYLFEDGGPRPGSAASCSSAVTAA